MSSLTTGLSVPVDGPVEAREHVEAAFDRCSPALYRYFAVRVGGDAHVADDLMQQLWLRATQAKTPVPEDQTEFWLRGIAANLIRERWRRQKRRPRTVPMADPQLAAELADRLVEEELPPEVLERKEVRDQLLLAITELPSGDQDLIAGHYFDGAAFAELGRRTGLSERAIEGRLYRARQALREKLRHLA